MRKAVPYEVFEGYVKELEDSGVLKKSRLFGYKKTFTDVLVENGLVSYASSALYVRSVIDGEEYCLSNGKLKRHLDSVGVDKFGYLEKCGITIPYGYSLSFVCDGKDVKSRLSEFKNGDNLYFMYRSLVTSVSTDYRKVMLLYGVPEEEAKIISDASHNRRSNSKLGEINKSYGRKGLNAYCFSPFFASDNPKECYSKFLRIKRDAMILKWASDNNIDETSFETVRLLYYSTLFKSLHTAKGKEYKDRLGLDTIQQGVYLFNKEKSLKCHDPKDSFSYFSKMIDLLGTDEDKKFYEELAKNDNYYGVMALSLFVRGMMGYGKRVPYVSERHGEFLLRSKLEKGFLYIADRLSFVKHISYETVRIPYQEGNKKRTYYVDFDVVLDNGKRVLIEVKPYSQCVIPGSTILLKKMAADDFALKNGCVYMFVTEKDLKNDLVSKKLQSY